MILMFGTSPSRSFAGVALPPEVLPEVLLSTRLNGVDTGDTALLLRTVEGRLMVRASDLLRWRLRLPQAAALQQDAEVFYRLDDMAGLTWQVDETRQALSLTAPATLFNATRLDLTAQQISSPARTASGGFLNYDLSSTRAASVRQTGALLELGSFNRLGSGTGTFALREGYATGKHLLRLETSWIHDMPEARASLRFGDAVTGSGQWARPTRFGGVQWATNFATQPGFVRFPLPTLGGEAALPSTVDLYVNGVLQARRNVPAGPFTLEQLPVMTGQGEARLVVRDLLGREQAIVAPYYASPRLLQTGLHDFSYEVGRIRNNFGLASNDYGRAAIAATHRLGLSDRLTVEGHGEWVESQQTGGVGAVLAWPGVATFNASGAASRSDPGVGGLVTLGAEHPSRTLSVGVNAQWATARFEQIGQQPGVPAVRENLQGYASFSLGRGSLSLGYTRQTPRDRDAVKLLILGYNVSLGSFGYLGVSLLRSGGPQGALLATLNYTRALDGRTSTSNSASLQHGEPQGQLQLQHNPPVGDGTGYRLVASGGAAARHLEADASIQRSFGSAGLNVASTDAQFAVRGSASGGVAWLDGGVYPSHRIDSSFALVQVPGQRGVGVFADNQLVGHTDTDGSVLVPRLRPYQKNPIRIEQADLPLDAQIGSLEMEALPAFRSGQVLRFPVRRARGATLMVMQEDGRPVPPGAMAHLPGVGEGFPFGAEGQLYLDGLEAHNQVTVRWPPGASAQDCVFDLDLPAGSDPLPDLGRLTCRSTAP
jgi:outer membrane usher protein